MVSRVSNGETNPIMLFLLACRYGELQGLNKQETAEKFGTEKVKEWRRSYNISPPNGESLEMCAERAVKYFIEKVRIQITVCLLKACSVAVVLIIHTKLDSER